MWSTSSVQGRRPWYICGILACVAALILLSVALVVCRHTSTAQESWCCPDKWTRYGETCYFVSKDTAVWKVAQKHCEAEGGSLLILDVTAQQHLEELFILKEDHWIGLRKEREEWNWTNGSAYTGQVKYDGPQVDCAYFNGEIGALDCSSQRSWICKKSL